ncbi:MAG: outer membrane beta-barrel protein [Bdellovibrionales bacterium]
MKKVLVTIALLGFGFSAHADRGMELQISAGVAGVNGTSGIGGTAGGIQINDEDTGDNSPWGLSGEVYKSMNDNMQVGGLLALSDADSTGMEMSYTLGVLGRYNFDTDLRNSMFVGAGLTYADLGVDGTDSTRMSLLLSFGKRYALSDTITYTPNITFEMGMGGDTGFDEGNRIAINLLSFSGFM